MDTEKFEIVTCSRDDLRLLIREENNRSLNILKEEISSLIENLHNGQLLTYKQLQTRIASPPSRPTLSKWLKEQKSGNQMLHEYRIGGKVYYKFSELLKVMQMKNYYRKTF